MMGTNEFKFRRFFWAALVLSLGIPCIAQQNPLDPNHPNAPIPQVTFELNWRVADPQYYEISVEPTGQASYQSQPLAQEGATPGDPYILRFIASDPTRTKIFQLAQELNHFQGNFETKNKVAQTGTKTLIYRFGGKETKTTLNYSDNPLMNELIEIFQKMSSTFEMGRKLDYDLRYDKLGLDRDLKSMEDMNKNHQLIETQVITPTFQHIASDPAVMNIARQRARRLLEESQIALKH